MSLATISAGQFGIPWPSAWGTSGTLKIIVNNVTFVFGGKTYVQGRISDPVNQRWCVQSAISVSVGVGTFASFSLPQTDTGITVINGSAVPKYTGIYYDSKGVKRGILFQDWHLSSSLTTSFNFEAWAIDNAAVTVVNPRTDFLSADGVNNAITARLNAPATTTQNGIGEVDTTPLDTAHPVFVGTNSVLLPTTGQRQALVGTSGTPSSSNRYITDADSRVPTQNENDALVGTSGSPSSSNKYVTASSFGATINVRDYATAGAGTSVSPWTGWDTAITWSPYTTYTFSDGYFGYSTSPQWGRCGIALLCGKNTYLKFTGSGIGFDFTARDTPAGFSLAITQAARIGPFRLVGNSGMTVGFDISGVQQCIFEDFRVKSVSQTAIKIRFSISCIYLMPRFSVNEEGTGHGTPVPVNGILLDNRSGGAEPCQDNTFIGAVAEGTTGYGIQLQGNCWLNTFIGGTSEANGGGISVGQLCKQNSFKGFDLEANTAYDVLNNGENSVFENLLCASSTGVVFDSFSKNSVWRDGQFQTATVNANAQDTLFDGVMGINVITSGGGIIDNGTNTAIQGFLHDLQSVGAGTYYGGGFNAWRTPTLLNSWANVGGTNAVAQYVKDAIGWVSIRGCISGGSTGVVVFTLPVGFRPAKDERFAVVTDTGYGSLSVSSSGDIVLVSGGTTSFVFMEARFRTV